MVQSSEARGKIKAEIQPDGERLVLNLRELPDSSLETTPATSQWPGDFEDTLTESHVRKSERYVFLEFARGLTATRNDSSPCA